MTEANSAVFAPHAFVTQHHAEAGLEMTAMRTGISDICAFDRLTFDRDEERRWRAERRAREEQRLREERRWLDRPTIVGLSATELRKAEWLEAMRWRRRVESICALSRLTFAQWLLLHSTERLIEETKDAVIQVQIAARIELDQTTVSQLVRRLEARRLVDRGGDITGKAWRVVLTDEATASLRDLDGPIESTSTKASADEEKAYSNVRSSSIHAGKVWQPNPTGQ